jgi:hypothetical protein
LSSQEKLLNAISNKAPHLSLLWFPLVLNDQAPPHLGMALERLSPINLIAAFWTNTLQSFLLVTSCRTHTSMIPRAEEFQTSFY